MTGKRKRGSPLPVSGAARAAAIERIVKATGKEPDSREKLAKNIASGYAAYCTDTPKGRGGRVEGVRKMMVKLEASINADPRIKSAIGKSLDFSTATAALHNLKINTPVPIGEHPGPRQPSDIEWYVGANLALIYEERFNARDTWRRDAVGKPQGAVIDFIEAVLTELKLSCSRETIGTALFRLRPNRRDMRAIAAMAKNNSKLGKFICTIDGPQKSEYLALHEAERVAAEWRI